MGKIKDSETALYTVIILLFLFFTACNRQEKTPENEITPKTGTPSDSALLALLQPADDLIRKTDYYSAIVYLTNLENDPAYAWSQNPISYIHLEQKLGIAHSLLVEYKKALTHLRRALKVADSIDNNTCRIEVYIDLAEMYRKHVYLDDATKMLEKADSIIKQHGAGIPTMARFLDRNVANYPNRYPSYPPDSSLAENRRALWFARMAGNRFLEASALNELGSRLYPSAKDSAYWYWHRAGVIFDSLGYHRDHANVLLNMAWGSAKPNIRLKYLDSCRAVLGTHHWWYISGMLAEYYSEFYQSYIPNMDSAVKYLNAEKKLTRWINGQFIETMAANAKADGEREIVLTKSNFELQKLYKNQQITFLVLAILMSIAGFFLFNWLRKLNAFGKLKETTDKLGVVNANLSTLLDEKAILVHEIHHRVKNNFQLIASLLKRQAILYGNPALKNEFEKAKLRILEMAAVHEIIYRHDNHMPVNFPEFLHSISNKMLDYFDLEKYTKLHISCDLQNITHANAVFWGMLLQELINNSFKYAVSPDKQLELFITVKCLANEVVFTYNDNGPGMPVQNQKTGMGTYILDANVRHFEGRQIVDREKPVIFSFAYTI